MESKNSATSKTENNPAVGKKYRKILGGLITFIGLVGSVASIASFIAPNESTLQAGIDKTTKVVAENFFLSDKYQIVEDSIQNIHFDKEFSISAEKPVFLGKEEKIPFVFYRNGTKTDSIQIKLDGDPSYQIIYTGDAINLRKTGWRLLFGGIVKNTKENPKFLFKTIPEIPKT